jgi:hypothetical protein
LRARIVVDASLTEAEKSEARVMEHFRLLQACDNLSLLTCVAFDGPANLLHPLALNDGGTTEVQVLPLGARHFRLSPWPFAEREMEFAFPARHVVGRLFADSRGLDAAFQTAAVDRLTVRLTG